MNFTQEDRKQVGIFFTKILSTYYKEPVYYEYIRGHLSKAPEVVGQYILRKCKGEGLLNYFRNHKNYFEVDRTYVSLKKKVNVTRLENPSNAKTKVPKPVKFVRSKSESVSSGASEKVKASAPSLNSSEKLEHEEYVFKHFTRKLDGGKEVDIESINFEELPKKVTHYLTIHFDKSLLNYFEKYKDAFLVKDKRVSLSQKVLKRTSSDVSDMKEFTSEDVHLASIDPDQEEAIAWLLSIEYFYKILKKVKGNTLHVDKLAGHLNQAKDCDCVKKFVNSHKYLIDFFRLSPALFRVTPMLQVSPSKYFNGVLNQFKNMIYEPSNESQLDTELTLMSSLQDLVRGHGSVTDEVEDDANSLGSFIPESNLSEDKESCKSSVNGQLGTEYESEERESYDDRLYNDDYETDDDRDNNWDEDYTIEPYNQETDYGDNYQMYNEEFGYADYDQSYNENFEEQTWVYHGNSEDVASKDSIDLLPIFSVDETEGKDDGNFSIMELSEQREAKLKFLFKVQLYCTEAVEIKNEYFKDHEVKCIKFFKQYLKAAVGGSTITSLQGSLGQAKPEVQSFMRKMYRGDKFASFFKEHVEFIINSSVVTLSLNCDEIFKNRLLLYTPYKKEFSYETLYGSSEYGSFLKETLDFVSEVLKRLTNSNKLKCSRIYSLINDFPTFLESIKLNCSNPDEETERFLGILDIFDISDGLISMSSKNSPISIKWLKEITETSHCSNSLPIEGQSNADGTRISQSSGNDDPSFELLCEISEYLTQDSSVFHDVSHYWEVVDILPTEILLKIETAGTDSRIILEAMLKNFKSLDKHSEVFYLEEQDDFTSGINQEDSNSLENVSLFLSETKKVEETGEIASQFTDNLGDINEEINQIQGTSIHHGNTNDKDDGEKGSSYSKYDASNCNGPPTLDISSVENIPFDKQDNSRSEICYSQELVVVETSINPSCDEIPVSKDSDIPHQDLQSAQSSDPVEQELISNNVDSFEKHKSTEDLNDHGHKNRFSSNSDSDLFESIPSSLSIEKMANKNDGGYSSDVTDCSENIDDTDGNFVKESDSSSVSDLDETSHNLTEVSVLPIFNPPLKSLQSETDGSDSSNNLENDNCIHNGSKLPSETENKNFVKESVLQNDSERICNQKSGDLNNAVSEKDKFELKENVSVILNECENKTSTGASKYLPPTNSEIKSISVMKTDAWILAKKFFSDHNNAVSEKDKFELKENVSVILNGREEKSSTETSKYLPPTNSEIKSISVMKTEAWSIAKKFFSNMCASDVICVASTELIFPFERKYFLNVNNARESKTLGYPTCVKEDNVKIFNKSSSQNQIESVGNGEMDQKHICKVSKDDKNDVKSQNPLQPIEARIILLTRDSCIAQVISSKQTIYFLKCVFSCDEEHCCSDCFDLLKIGDHVSCFVPIPELSRKVWIPIMVSKDGSREFNGTDQINEVLQNQKVDDAYRKCEFGYPLPSKVVPHLENASVQTENKIVENKDCQTELVVSDAYSQTDLSGEVARDVAWCQTEPVPVEDAYVQVGCDTVSSGFQTELSYLNAISNESQTDITGSVKICVNTEMSFSQTNVSGEIKEMVEVVDKISQTIATGPVFAQQFYHL